MNCIKGYEIVSELEETIYSIEDIALKHSLKIRRYDIIIYFLCTTRKINSRKLHLYIPVYKEQTRVPLIMNVHYPVSPREKLAFEYLKKGWAILSPTNLPNDIGFPKGRAGLAGDDLRYNMAMLDLARRLKFIDSNRIALKGGSAGGYQMLMLSITHFGILCGYCLSGIVNLAYEYKYIVENNKINEEYEKYPEKFNHILDVNKFKPYVNTTIEHKLPEDDQFAYSNYPLPRIKVAGMNYFVPSIVETFDAYDLENSKWHDFSPICHVEKICHPLLISHSTADVIVPIYQITEKNAYQNIEDNFPEGYKYHLRNLMNSERLRKPLDELFPPEEIEVFVLNPYKGDYDNMLRFSPEKRLSINIIDEWKPERTFGHFRDRSKAEVSDISFFEYYFGQCAWKTNRLTKPKLEIMAHRYLGKMSLLEEENEYKNKYCSGLFGSIYSDRMDILLSLATYLGIDIWAEYEIIVLQNVCKKHTIRYSEENYKYFEDTYESLEKSLRFLDNETIIGTKEFLEDPIKYLVKGIGVYANLCGEKELSNISNQLCMFAKF